MSREDDEDVRFERAVGAAIAEDPPVPSSFGPSTLRPGAPRYELVGVIGRGGIGTVWRARDLDLSRDVAVKVLRREFEISPSAVASFVAEARVTGAMQHPGIPPVYEVGRFPDGRVYLAMKLIRGRTLAALFRAGPPDETTRPPYRQYLESVCQTVAFAHANGIAHGDLKSNNVMVGEFGEVHVTDWGLARATRPAESGDDTPVSAVASPTPDGSPHACDERDDVYRLGVMLYETMTGHAFAGSDSFDSFDRVVEGEPLRSLVRSCLAPDKADRPPTAELVRAFRDDATRTQSRLRELELDRVRAEERRRRTRLTRTFVAIAALALIAAVGFRFWQRIERDRADRDLRERVRQKLDEADRELRVGRGDRALAAARAAEGIVGSADEAVGRRLADVRMLDRLESIRIREPTPSVAPTRRPRAELALNREAPRQYAVAFQDYGLAIEGTPEDTLVRTIRETPIRDALVRALDDWAPLESRPELRERLRRLADGADAPDRDVSRRVRAARAKGDDAELERVAASLSDSEPSETVVAVAHALRVRGKLDAADRLLTDARRRSPREFWVNLEWGVVRALLAPNEPARWLPGIESAFAVSNGNADTFTYLGIAQTAANRHADAEASFRRALAVTPRLPGGTIRLAYALAAQAKPKDALAAVDAAIAADPDDPLGAFNRGVVLQLLKEGEGEIVSAYRRAVELDPTFIEAWNNLGNALTSLRKFDEADAAFANALAVNRDYAKASFNRAVLNDLRDRTDAAIAQYRDAIAADVGYAEAYYNLGHDLAYLKGRFAEARTVLGRGLTHVPAADPARGKWRRLADSCEAWEMQDRRLTALLAAMENPATAKEATELAPMAAWPHRRDYRTAVAYFVFAFEREPRLADDLVQGYRYFAAGCAARVGGDRAMRDRAREWLSADFTIRDRQLRTGDPALVMDVKAKLRYWLSDPTFAPIRDAASLNRLDDAERTSWAAFWDRVRTAAQ